MRRRWTAAGVSVAVAAYFAMAVSGVAHKSGTFDEFAHITAGYTYWAYNDYRLQPDNGNWPQRLVALPVVLGGSPFPTLDQLAWAKSGVGTIAGQFFFGTGNDADRLLRRGRMMVALVGALLGILVFLWSRVLFGEAGAWVSLFVYVFSPTMLAHGALATSDVMGAAFFTAAVWALWTVLRRITPWTLAASTFALSGALLSKHSAPILIAIALCLLAVRLIVGRPLTIHWRRHHISIRGRFAQCPALLGLTLAHVVVAFLLIWGSYSFRYDAMSAHTTPQDSFLDPWPELLDTPSVTTRMAQWGRDHHVLPEAYLYGLSSVMAYSKHRVAFLNGAVTTNGGWRWFFPYAGLVKTTLPALLLLAGVPLMLAWRWRDRRAGTSPDTGMQGDLYGLTPLVVLIVVYGALAMVSGVNVGYRHMLPIIPATIVLVGVTGDAISRGLLHRRSSAVAVGGRNWTTVAAVSVGALLIWHATESVRIWPNYLAYFNQLDGGPKHAYRHLVDSSLDWGQDLPGLKDWLDREGLQGAGHTPVFLSYFGAARPEYYKIDAKPLPSFFDRSLPHVPEPLTGGVYCISATMLNGVYLEESGAWSPESERKYQSTIHDLQIFESTEKNAAARAALLRQTGPDYWVRAFHGWEQLRFARLAAYLRHREADAEIGYSILIYRVADADVDQALFGPRP